MTRCDMPLRCAAASRVVRACTRTGALRDSTPDAQVRNPDVDWCSLICAEP
jgi:hypothetical protein